MSTIQEELMKCEVARLRHKVAVGERIVNEQVICMVVLEEVVEQLLDLLLLSEHAIMEAILSEDGLDGDHGREVVEVVSDVLLKHMRESRWDMLAVEGREE